MLNNIKPKNATIAANKKKWRSHHGAPRSKCTGCLTTQAFESLSNITATSTIVTPISKERPNLKEFIIAKSFAPNPGIPINAVKTTIARQSIITWLSPTRSSVRAAGI